jgi:hypothetical protein
VSESDFSGPVVATAQHAATAAVVEERVHGFLEHALLVADDDVGGLEVEELLQPVVAVDDAPVQVVEIGRRKPAAVQRHERPQLGRDDRDHVQDHPLGAVAALAERVDHLEPLRVLQALLHRGFVPHLVAHLTGEMVDVDTGEKLLDGLGAHPAVNWSGILVHQLAVLLFREALALFERGHVTRIDDAIRLEVEDALEVPQRHVEQCPMRDGSPLKNHTWLTGEASSM